MENQNIINFYKQALNDFMNNTKSWVDLAKEFKEIFGETLSSDSLRKRAKYWAEKESDYNNSSNGRNNDSEYCTYYNDNTLEARKIVNLPRDVFNDKKSLLSHLGYNPNEWEFVFVKWSSWEQSSKKDGLKNLYAVNFKLKPIYKITPELAIDAAKELFAKNLQPIKTDFEGNITNPNDIEKLLKSNSGRLMEIAPIELHLGKLATKLDSGDDYNVDIASDKFYKIFEDIIKKQEIEKCEKCLLVIGNDFFNSESDSATTNKTPQYNDTSYKNIFIIGLQLYIEAILLLRENFRQIDVIICEGNHARSMEFFLYMALQQYFLSDNIVYFRKDYKDTQCYKWGNCAIFYNHGDFDLKRTIKSIPAEFFEIWGNTIYRELHLGHLHKEFTVDDDSGMITRRIGSPTNTDTWHYQNRFIGAVKKHQIFIWNSDTGLENIYYINC